jgi:hypothetical protein
MSTTRTRRTTAALALTATALIGGVLVAGPADAKAGDVIKSGGCSAGGAWKLKAGPQNGSIEVEYEINARSGQKWRVIIKDNGLTRVNTTRTTVAGALHVRKVVTNLAGTDVITARARNLTTGSLCTGSLRF